MKHQPVLFLDFDLTLFDTNQFYDWLGEDRFPRILDLSSGKLEAPDFSTMIYEDCLPFLQKAKERYRLVLLTYTVNTALQRRKVRGSGLVPFFADIIMTQGSKGLEAKKYLTHMHGSGGPSCSDCAGRVGGEHVFVDDAPENIDDMKRINPEIKSIRIDRTQPTAETLMHHTGPDLVVQSLRALTPILCKIS